MATEIFTRIIDDLDKTVINDGEGVRVKFTYEGGTYQLDLTHANAEKFYESMAFWANKGMLVDGKKARPREPKETAQPRKTKREGIRQWARENGYAVKYAGQVPRDIVQAFDLAHAS